MHRRLCKDKILGVGLLDMLWWDVLFDIYNCFMREMCMAGVHTAMLGTHSAGSKALGVI